MKQKQIDDPGKEKILSAITELYMREGFNKTSMDSIASRLQVSKKTIYKYFPSKDVLVEEAVYFMVKTISGKIEAVTSMDADSFTKLHKVFELIGELLSKLGEKWLTDLHTHRPALWKYIDEFRARKMFALLSGLIEQGKKEGLISNIPTEIVIMAMVSSLRAIVSPDFLYHNKFSYSEAVGMTFGIFFKGILTGDGRKKFKFQITK